MTNKVMVLVLCGLLQYAPSAFAADPSDGLTVWTLVGTNPEFTKAQEVRVGYEGMLPGMEAALGVLHLDGPDPEVEEWSGRAYLLAHALDARMIASFLGNGITLPDGNLYGGLFGQYTYDRDDEWSGGYVVGGLVDWPKGWQTVAEYQTNIWNNDRDSFAFIVGLRKKF